ncbi:MAG: 50S ribosomal protein L28 [Candidatus Sungiibacteriota bacterium]
MKTCALCDKGSVSAGTRSFLRSHYNPTSTIRKYPNLQWARLASSATRKKICVKCMKKLHG